ncbi:hypothetical protein FB451DRAFT_1392685 [Mycena latifolia]|nr:hypothetical protein FB451DRAFT_1392685 [Mycena latifolia]
MQLSYIGLAAYLVAAGVQSAGCARWGRTGYWLRVDGCGVPCIWGAVFIVTMVFWALLSSPDTFSTAFSAWSNTSLHVLNSAFALLELLMTNAPPAPLLALPVQILLLAGYLGVAYITKARQGLYCVWFSLVFALFFPFSWAAPRCRCASDASDTRAAVP